MDIICCLWILTLPLRSVKKGRFENLLRRKRGGILPTLKTFFQYPLLGF